MRTDMTDKIVWVLGAGFSWSLGAPLLRDLLSLESRDRVRHAFKGAFADTDLTDSVIDLYRAGCWKLDDRRPDSIDCLARHWEHAEEFLENLDLIGTGKHPRVEHKKAEFEALIKKMMERTTGAEHDRMAHILREEFYPAMRAHALRMVAAECCEFLQNAGVGGERWTPYRQWAYGLTSSDTILTFNYDRVPEVLSRHTRHGEPEREDKLWVPSPFQVQQRLNKQGGEWKDLPLVLKLHGSVDWLQQGLEVVVQGVGPNMSVGAQIHRAPEGAEPDKAACAAVFCEAAELAIAIPGPSKQEMTGIRGPLESMWKLATQKLHEADAIVFIGYRIPPTDAASRAWLAKGLRGSQRVKNRLVESKRSRNPVEPRPHVLPLLVHTVLGANVEHEHSRRMKGIIEALQSEEHMELRQWAMGAEDFLGIVSRMDILRPAKSPMYPTSI